MEDTPTVRALLEVEDEASELLLETVPGTDALLWPLVRWPLARALSEEGLNVTSVPRKRPSRPKALVQHALGMVPTPVSSDRLREPVEHLFIVSGTTRVETLGGVGNWLTDSYATALDERAAVVQDAPLRYGGPRSERPLVARTWSFSRALRRVDQRTRLEPLAAKELSQFDSIMADMLAPFSRQLSERLRSRVHTQVVYRVNRLPHVAREFRGLLERTRPRRIYMQTAAYGDRSNLIRIAHERGIEVAELQHGWIGASHAAYNFGAVMRRPELLACLPDTLLTFGEYWGEEVRFPGRVIPVGKPSLEEAARVAVPYEKRPPRVLVVSSIMERERLISVTQSLRRQLPDHWQVVFRPHPSERATVNELYAALLDDGVEVDVQSEVNSSISNSKAVIGMVSTVLYEALAFGVHIGVIETDLADHYSSAKMFPDRISDDSSLALFANRIASGDAPHSTPEARVWQSESVGSFQSFARN
ncbi:hypothetical protein ACIFOC_00904 [Leucobacter aridicollis]|nr:hypothetical protein [Leucobacter aridicollis]